MLGDLAAKDCCTTTISEVVPSTVRQVGDLSYRLVLEDCCADNDAELHKVLCEDVFTKQSNRHRSWTVCFEPLKTKSVGDGRNDAPAGPYQLRVDGLDTSHRQ